MDTNILFQIEREYYNLVPSTEFYDVDNVYNYYYAKEVNSRIYAEKLTYIDIKSAFPTLCNIVFDADDPFLVQLNSIEDKLERNIFLGKSLGGTNQLQSFNKYCKIVLFSHLYNNYENIEIFEYQKDGVLFSGEKTGILNKKLHNIITTNFKFHLEKIDTYFRFNDSSIYQKNDIVTIKGKYKSPPKYVLDIINIIINDPYDPKLKDVIRIYSNKYFEIVKYIKLHDLIKQYYIFNEKYYLNNIGNKTTNIEELYIPATLQFIIYPILSMLRKK